MELQVFVIVLFSRILTGICVQNFYVAAPSSLRLNSEETIAVAIDGDEGALVSVYIQDHPGKIKNISQKLLPVQPGHPNILKIRLEPADFPPNFLTEPGFPKLVSLNADFQSFHKEILIPISKQSGYVFIQTDKPIYTPKQRAIIRIIPLNEDAQLTNETFQLQIRNPDNIIVEEKYFNDRLTKLDKAIVSHIYMFPTYPILGEWSAIVRYGHNLEQNSTVHFDLEEYVLPTFTVQLKTPDVILQNAEVIEVEVSAKHVYGEKVKGVVTFRLGIIEEHTEDAIYFAVSLPNELDDGSYTLKLENVEMKQRRDIGWFPEIVGSRLLVEATVVEAATGNREMAVDSSGRFSKSPFVISFKRCLEDFKPGLTSVFEADISYVGGLPASDIRVKINAVADNEKKLHVAFDVAKSDRNGKVSLEIHPEIHHRTITLTLETDDPRYEGSQAKASFVQRACESKHNAYIAVARSSPQRLQPGDNFAKEIHYHPADIQNIHYLVVARGKILVMKKVPLGAFKNKRVQFQITQEMVPSFRVVVFAHHQDELIADTLKIDVERICSPNAQVAVDPVFNDKEPGKIGKIIIRGRKGTTVGLLGVDDAVYALSKKDLLTQAEVFDRLASHDLGCGPGGGFTVNSVLGNAGITLGTNIFSPSLSHACVERKRKKREALRDIVKKYSGNDKRCCSLGLEMDKYGRNCRERTNVIVRHLNGEYPHCTKAFLECCIFAEKNGHLLIIGRKAGEAFDHLTEAQLDSFEKQEIVRRDFRETWIYEDITIGPDGREELPISLPHSITTWVIQAVSVSPTNGICITEPQTLVSFKKIFLHLNLPYSVVRNEQVEIQATVFNYGDKTIEAYIYMYGAMELCSGTHAGEKSERKTVLINGQSAATVTFPVIPLKAEDFPIKVVVYSPAGRDIVEKQLHVVPEGVTKEVDISIKLDPTNQQKRTKRHIETALYTDHIDPTQNLQIIVIKLAAPEGFVPGTASCSITALGDMFGPVVETSINNPDRLIDKPHGCGEQNMMHMAPTLYTVKYLKVSGKLTAESEEKGYAFIRQGYVNELAFRKEDGSYAAHKDTPTSTWLTAFVMKVFCQASELIHIDDNVMSSGLKWLIKNQEPDGSYIEKHPTFHADMMGGVQGRTPMTAFTLIALEECKRDEEDIFLIKTRAVAFLESHLDEVNTTLPAAIVAYALSLSNSDLKQTANDKLLSMAKYYEGPNTLHWITENSAQDIETAGYGLLTQLLFNDMSRSGSIVNWLNTKQLQSGSFQSTQDTVVALQAMSEYAIRAQMPSINLVANITSSRDSNFHKVLTFHEGNALVLKEVKINKIGGYVYITSTGHGIGSLSAKLRYNMAVPVEDICKFDISVNVTEPKDEPEGRISQHGDKLNPEASTIIDRFSEVLKGIKKKLEDLPPVRNIGPRNRKPRLFSLLAAPPVIRNRTKREDPEPGENRKFKLNIDLCVRYLANRDAGMSIVDVGIFSGFEAVTKDLQKLVDDRSHLIQRFERSNRGVVFYLQRIPVAENYCFSFHVVREYIVENTQTSVIKVYDYYNSDAECTKFYSAGSNSPIIRTICNGGVCECAEGGCPPKTPFSEVSSLTPVRAKEELKQTFCKNYNYVWLGKLNGQLQRSGGYLNISFTIENVVKAGIEKTEGIEGKTRTLLARKNCLTANLLQGVTYLILGKDGQRYMNENEMTWYRYILDQTSIVYMWTPLKDALDPQLQRDLNFVVRTLKEKGCDG